MPILRDGVEPHPAVGFFFDFYLRSSALISGKNPFLNQLYPPPGRSPSQGLKDLAPNITGDITSDGVNPGVKQKNHPNAVRKASGHNLTAKGQWLTAFFSVIKDQPATSHSEMLLRDITNQHAFQLTKNGNFIGDTSL